MVSGTNIQQSGGNYNNIPAELKALPQWVAYGPRLNKQGEMIHKMPINPRTGGNAIPTLKQTWSTFEQAIEAKIKYPDIAGIGFVFIKEDPYCGIDLDKCRNVETGELEPWASSIAADMDSYSEISASGTGIHIIIQGKAPGKLHKKGQVEIYDTGRYFIMTGNQLPGESLCEQRQEALDRLYAETFGDEQNPADKPAIPATIPMDNDEVIRRIETSKQAQEFKRLWQGDTSGHGGDDSAADLAFCSIVGYWTGGDMARVDTLFRQSGLMRPKWERADYRNATISKALSGGRFFDPERIKPATMRTRKAPEFEQANGESKTETIDNVENAVAWPEPMEEAAFYGLAGRIAKAIAPETEADEAAILINVVLTFGAMVGRGPYIQAGGVRHGCNLFACLTGGTSKGRKGSSWGPVEKLFRLVDESFIREKTPGGLSTGEGLIWAVRDPIEKPKKRKSGECSSGPVEMEIEIPGVDDKRLLLIESELGQVLQVLKREGNTLSAILRQAWDGKECLQSLTKAVKGKTTGAHISMIGHVTKDELTANFASVELLNGLGNRILWVCVRRSKLLPEGGNIPDMGQYAEELAEALSFASTGPQCGKSDEAAALWKRVYPGLTEDRAGLWGAATARAEAQVIRLAMIYSLMDCTDTISPEHLRAALAVWGYGEDSAKFIFSGQADDPVIGNR